MGIAAIFGIIFFIFAPLYVLSTFFWGIAIAAIGVLAAGSSRFVTRLGPALWLIILAIIASVLGAAWIAWLIALGGILGILSRLWRR